MVRGEEKVIGSTSYTPLKTVLIDAFFRKLLLLIGIERLTRSDGDIRNKVLWCQQSKKNRGVPPLFRDGKSQSACHHTYIGINQEHTNQERKKERHKTLVIKNVGVGFREGVGGI